MEVFVGQAHGAAMVAQLRVHGWGECVLPFEYPPIRDPWFFDCGAFRLYQRGMRRCGRPDEWQPLPFIRVLWRIRRGDSSRPRFILLPDIVGGGLVSLARSLRWIARCRRVLPGVPLYLAVQDGMTPADVTPRLGGLGGIFVGGSLKWKIATGEAWARLADEHGVAFHIGRCGGIERVLWARRIAARHPRLRLSIDSTLPIFSQENLARFVRALGSKQLELIP